LTVELGSELLVAVDLEAELEAAHSRLRRLLTSGAGLDRFRQMVQAQGGDLEALRSIAPISELAADRGGWLVGVDGHELGRVMIDLGGGRKVLADRIDHSVGLEMLVRIGDPIESGQPLVRVFARLGDFERVQPMIHRALMIGEEPVDPPPLLCGRIC
jgi:thymidine phosphorylase